jgi:hypothetical protein
MEQEMRAFGIDDDQRLELARERARDLRKDWQRANGTRAERAGGRAYRLGLIARIRMVTGQRIIGVGSRIAARQSGPCG